MSLLPLSLLHKGTFRQTLWILRIFGLCWFTSILTTSSRTLGLYIASLSPSSYLTIFLQAQSTVMSSTQPRCPPIPLLPLSLRRDISLNGFQWIHLNAKHIILWLPKANHTVIQDWRAFVLFYNSLGEATFLSKFVPGLILTAYISTQIENTFMHNKSATSRHHAAFTLSK